MLISIIIPIYNVEAYIEECLESVYQQTYPDIEVILVNDCTPDGSMVIVNAIAEKYKDKYPTTIINHEQNKGLSEARNSGMKAAKGEYIYFVDSDDAIMPDAIRLLADVAIEHKGIELVEGGHFSSFPPAKKQTSLKTYYDNESKYQLLNDKNGDYIWNILLNRAFIKRNSLSFQAHIINEDGRFRHQAAKYITSFSIIKNKTYFYRLTPNSLTNNISKLHFERMIQMFNRDFSSPNMNTLQINYFCRFAFNYWNKSWRKSYYHILYHSKVSIFAKQFFIRHYKSMNLSNIFLLSPIFLPYRIAIYYVKIIWNIRRVIRI